MSKLDASTSLPASWNCVPLKELGDWSGGGTPSKAKPQYWQGGTIPWVSPKDMKTDRISDSEDYITKEAVSHSATSLINPGSVLIVTRSGILRHTLPVAVSSVAVTVNQDLKALTPRNGIIAEYVAWALRAFGRDILNACSKQGTTVNSIETAKLLRFEIPVAPIEQQKRIVAEIEKQFSRLDEAIANLKRVKANLKRYKAAVLKAAVEGKLTEDWRKAHPNVEPASRLLERILAEPSAKRNSSSLDSLDCSRFCKLPPTWCWSRIEDIGEVQLGRQRAPKYHSGRNMRPYLRVQNVFEDRIDLEDVMEMDFPPADFERFRLVPGDVLLNEGQSPELLGRPAIYRGELPGACFTNTLIRFRVNALMKPNYPFLVFRAYMRNRRFTKEGTITTNIAHLSAGRFAKIEFPLPPLQEQEFIVAEVERRLSVMDEIEATIEANLTRADRLRQSILGKAFSGNLSFNGLRG